MLFDVVLTLLKIKTNSYSMKEKILVALKTKYKTFGFGDKAFDVVLTLLMLLLLIKLLPLQYKVTHQRCVTNKDITNSVSDNKSNTDGNTKTKLL